MTRIAGLTSGRGRSLLHVAETSPGGAEVAAILTDDPEAPVLDLAADRGIATDVVDPRDGGAAVADALAAHGPDLVCLDGYEPGPGAVDLADLPTTFAVEYALSGDGGPAAALSAGAKVTGATVRLVTDAGDVTAAGGPIVAQEPVPVFGDDTPEVLGERVLTRGAFRAYPRAVALFAAGRVTVDEEAGEVRVEAPGDRGEGGEAGAEAREDRGEGGEDGVGGAAGDGFPARYLEGADRARELRYGENPHQNAAVYADYTATEASVVGVPQRNEGAKALSYNNYNDADAALNLVRDFEEPTAAVIKHTNPAGCAAAEGIAEAYDRALATDPKSAFGGVVALNRECDAATAASITDSFKEVVVAPGYTDEALDVLREKDNLRVLDVGELRAPTGRFAEKHLVGGRLVQERDRQRPSRADLEVVTGREPTDEQLRSLLFAWQVVKHVKSNAIVFASGTETVGVGAGQVSRVDAVELAARKADRDAEGKSADGAVMASDAFFPFPDGVEAAAAAGVEAVIQPGGSINDEDVIDACDDRGLAMVFTGRRAFRHD